MEIFLAVMIIVRLFCFVTSTQHFLLISRKKVLFGNGFKSRVQLKDQSTCRHHERLFQTFSLSVVDGEVSDNPTFIFILGIGVDERSPGLRAQCIQSQTVANGCRTDKKDVESGCGGGGVSKGCRMPHLQPSSNPDCQI